MGNVGSARADVARRKYTLRELRARLASLCWDDDDFAADEQDGAIKCDPFDETPEETAAIASLRAAAEAGQSEAQFNLGLCYKRGEGVERDAAAAVHWFSRAAREGHEPLAQTNLGVSYYFGEGVEQNATEAVGWFGLAAEQGEPNAMHNLGMCYAQGVGVPRADKLRALELLARAAQKGHGGARAAYETLAAECETRA